jgi:hypothetical protein
MRGNRRSSALVPVIERSPRSIFKSLRIRPEGAVVRSGSAHLSDIANEQRRASRPDVSPVGARGAPAHECPSPRREQAGRFGSLHLLDRCAGQRHPPSRRLRRGAARREPGPGRVRRDMAGQRLRGQILQLEVVRCARAAHESQKATHHHQERMTAPHADAEMQSALRFPRCKAWQIPRKKSADR